VPIIEFLRIVGPALPSYGNVSKNHSHINE